ncbi:hypothetical protein vseg_013358 [Gypsophila vaccaria]
MNDLRSMLIGMQKSQKHLIAQVAKTEQDKSSAIKNRETRVAQLEDTQAQRQQGRLPPQPKNPNGNVHQLMAIQSRRTEGYSVHLESG